MRRKSTCPNCKKGQLKTVAQGNDTGNIQRKVRRGRGKDRHGNQKPIAIHWKTVSNPNTRNMPAFLWLRCNNGECQQHYLCRGRSLADAVRRLMVATTERFE